MLKRPAATSSSSAIRYAETETDEAELATDAVNSPRVGSLLLSCYILPAQLFTKSSMQ